MALTGKERADFIARMTAAGVKDVEVMSGIVIADTVDTDTLTCSVEVLWQDEPIEGVLLNVIESNVKGCYAIPEDASIVHMVSLDGPGLYQIIKTERIKEIHVDVSELIKVKVAELQIDAGNSSLTGKNDEWAFNGGNNGGVPVSNKVAQRLNKIETDVNNLKTVFSTWVPVSNDGGAALKSASATWFAQQLQPTQETDIDNPQVKH